jgi:hypothetical protein
MPTVVHTVLFEFSGAGLGRTSSFNVDDISLDVLCPRQPLDALAESDTSQHRVR